MLQNSQRAVCKPQQHIAQFSKENLFRTISLPDWIDALLRLVKTGKDKTKRYACAALKNLVYNGTLRVFL